MTPPPALVDANGRPVRLDRQLASGGEGAVFTLSNDTALVAKVYHKPPTAQTAEKLATMIRLANLQLLALAAWPKGLLSHATTRQLAGFVMPRLKDCQPIQHLYNPVKRLKFFPRAGWKFQVRTASNLAAAFEEVHKAGCLVGDVNQSNVQVSAQALVRLIDCDSFQVQHNGRVYPCEVGVPHYIPPELQRKSLRGLVRTENHDRFGLAVLIYQLLFVGRHPYAGVYSGSADLSFEQLIAEYRFAQGPAAQTWGMAPPPHTPIFADIPPELGNLFRRSFERGSEAGYRPRPTDWLAALKPLEASLIKCSAHPGHEYWSGANACVWCRLADRGGPDYYFGVNGTGSSFIVEEAKLQDVLRRLNACGPFDFPYDRKTFEPSQAPTPRPLPLGVVKPGFWRNLLSVLISTPWSREKRIRRDTLYQARHQLAELEKKWTNTVYGYQLAHSQRLQQLQILITDYRRLAARFQRERDRLTANAEAAARCCHLRLHLIVEADIPGIGTVRKQILDSNGVRTADDINSTEIRRIKGFGEVLTANLLKWKRDVLDQFRFDAERAVSPSQEPTLREMSRTGEAVLSEVNQQLAVLETLAPECRKALNQLHSDLRHAVALCAQADADLNLMDILSNSGHSLTATTMYHEDIFL